MVPKRLICAIYCVPGGTATAVGRYNEEFTGDSRPPPQLTAASPASVAGGVAEHVESAAALIAAQQAPVAVIPAVRATTTDLGTGAEAHAQLLAQDSPATPATMESLQALVEVLLAENQSYRARMQLHGNGVEEGAAGYGIGGNQGSIDTGGGGGRSFTNYITIELQALPNSRCVFHPTPWVPGLRTKTCLDIYMIINIPIYIYIYIYIYMIVNISIHLHIHIYIYIYMSRRVLVRRPGTQLLE